MPSDSGVGLTNGEVTTEGVSSWATATLARSRSVGMETAASMTTGLCRWIQRILEDLNESCHSENGPSEQAIRMGVVCCLGRVAPSHSRSAALA
jgi:hypothetical protein